MARPLTVARPPALTETAFLGMVIELAGHLGYHAAHFRPAVTSHGWRTPVQGSLGKGWIDLTLIRPRDGRLVFAELKSDVGRTTPDQEFVLGVLRSIPGAGVFVWRPRDWDAIVVELQR